MSELNDLVVKLVLSALRQKLETDAGRFRPPGPGPDPKARSFGAVANPLLPAHGREGLIATGEAFGWELGTSYDWPLGAGPDLPAVVDELNRLMPAVFRHDWTDAPWAGDELAANRDRLNTLLGNPC